MLKGHLAWLNAGRPKAREQERGRLEGDWSYVDLSGRDLSWIDGRGVNLHGACLDRSSFRGAFLTGADLTEASVEDTDFESARMSKAKIAETRGLSADLIGGADLSSTDPPTGIKDFVGLKTVEQVSSYLQGLFKIILTICAFGVLTMLSFRDEQILDHHGSTTAQLPLIQAAVSPAMFTALVPIVIFMFQTYFAIYVLTLWKELSLLPAIFPDGMTLDRRAYPTLFNTFVRLHFRLLRERLSDWMRRSFRLFWVSTYLRFRFFASGSLICAGTS